MTVIAWDGKTLASDSLVCLGNAVYSSQKIFSNDEYLVGISGEAAVGLELVEWIFEKGMNKADFPSKQKEEMLCNVLLIKKDRSTYFIENSHVPYPIFSKHIALGAGADMALGVMHSGKNAIDAVEIAVKLNAHCAGEAKSIDFDEWVKNAR
ncbi:MAG: hypothetical protein V4629_03175 [Pseudomonadota bacterium]